MGEHERKQWIGLRIIEFKFNSGIFEPDLKNHKTVML